MPVRFTPSLTGDETFPSQWHDWAPVFRYVWQHAFGITFDAWQEWLLRHLLEVYPEDHPKAGRLRFAQAFVSLGRQSGKSEIAAVIGLWGLLRKRGAITVGLASNREQADIVLRRARLAISANPELEKLFSRVTATKGLELRDGATYTLKPARSASIQGLAIHTGILDELHVMPSGLWGDAVRGTGARPDSFVFGITTAGSSDSALLIELYEKAAAAIAGDPNQDRFGAFVWEAPESRVPDDNAELIELLKPANPRLASGGVDPDDFVRMVRATDGGNPAIIRYSLNRFIQSEEALIDSDTWERARAPHGSTFPDGPRVFCLDQTPERTYASIAVAVRDEHGVTHTELVAWINRPTLDQLIRLCEQLNIRHSPYTFAIDRFNSQLITELERKGIPVTRLGLADAVSGTSLLLSRLAQGTLRHGGEPVLSRQIPNTRRKVVGEGFRIVRQGAEFIDSVCATAGAVLIAETAEADTRIGVF